MFPHDDPSVLSPTTSPSSRRYGPSIDPPWSARLFPFVLPMLPFNMSLLNILSAESIELILNELTIFEIIIISTYSKKVQELIQSARYRLQLVDILDTEHNYERRLKVGNDKEFVLFVNFNELPGGEADKLEVDGLGSVEYFPILNQHFGVQEFTKLKLELIVKHLLNTFVVEKVNLNLNDCRIDNPLDHFAFKFTRRFHCIQLNDRNKLCLTAAQVTSILEDFRIGALILNFKLKDGEEEFKYCTGLKPFEISLTSPPWLHFDAVLNSESAYISIQEHDFTSANWNQLIKKWMSGDLNNLITVHHRYSHSLRTERSRGWQEEFAEQVFEGVEKKKTANGESQMVLFRTSTNILNAMFSRYDLIRSDGKRASVGIEESVFRMHVWGPEVYQQFEEGFGEEQLRERRKLLPDIF